MALISESSALAAPNSIASLRAARSAGKLTWIWPLLFCFLRFPLLALGFVIADGLLRARGAANAGGAAQAFTRYDMPLLADSLCLAVLGWRLRREGFTFKNLLAPTWRRLWRDLGRSILILVPLAAFSALIVVGALLLSSSTNLEVNGPLINPFGLPWQVVISLLIIPVSSGITEELVYRGYALPRLAAFTGKQWQAIAITAFGFGLQHVAFLLVDWRLALVMGVAMTLVGAGFGLAYLAARQRLLPLILIHWQADFLALGLAPLVLWVVFK